MKGDSLNLKDLEDIVDALYHEEMMLETTFYELKTLILNGNKTIVEKAVIGILADYDNKSAERTIDIYMNKIGIKV